MAKQGDLVVEIGADIAPFVDEMRRASEQAKQAGTSIARSFKDGYKLAAPGATDAQAGGYGLAVDFGSDMDRRAREGERRARAAFAQMLSEDRMQAQAASGGGRGGGNPGGLARGVGQIGFAVQDFASVYSIGGRQATERALMSTMNNVQMLGMALGPMGMAVTAVAGALGSLLIPKLFATGEAIEKTAKDLDDGLEHIKRINSGETALARSVRSAISGGTSGAVRGSIESIDFEATLAAREKDRLKREYESRMDMAIRSGHLVRTATGSLEDGKTRWGSSMPEAEVARAGLAEVAKAIAEIESRERDLSVTRSAASMKLEELVKAEAAEAQQKRQGELLQRRLDETTDRAERAYNIKQGNLTPFQRVQQQLTEIGDLQGLLGADASVIAARIVKDFKRHRGGDTANLAVGGGEARTASGFSDIMKSIRQMSSPETEEQKKQTAVLERMLERLTSGLRLDPPVREETL